MIVFERLFIKIAGGLDIVELIKAVSQIHARYGTVRPKVGASFSNQGFIFAQSGGKGFAGCSKLGLLISLKTLFKQ
ncbi:hypothetical protein THIOM_001588 [Candidatus Thiomargarita nelsonii]|uniref:Uncharacterized protein n=1 Tax=Candidatus Thiomargarita nelsonii TaxID=1003181 RepID=A0A176S3V5_9GAMM|nr:hypothetical protein THIOM_001588 [Candidatus Thiomargarita nelsonii]